MPVNTTNKCDENGASEAGHDRALGAVPTMMFNNEVVTYDAWALCQFDQAASSQQTCARKPLRNSIAVSGAPAPCRQNVGGLWRRKRLACRGLAARCNRYANQQTDVRPARMFCGQVRV